MKIYIEKNDPEIVISHDPYNERATIKEAIDIFTSLMKEHGEKSAFMISDEAIIIVAEKNVAKYDEGEDE